MSRAGSSHNLTLKPTAALAAFVYMLPCCWLTPLPPHPLPVCLPLHGVAEARTKAQGGQQKCTSFSAHDKGAMAQLPDALRRTFPFVVTHRAAVTKQVVDAMSTLVISPASFSHFARTVREGHAGYILSSNEALASMAEMQRSQGSMAARGAVAPLDTKVSTPGAGYYINIFLNAVDECRRRQHYQQLLQLTVSPIWRFDHCHKPSKLVRLKDGSRASEGTGVLAGCFMQIMGWWNVDSTSLDVVKEPLRLVRERCKALGTVSDNKTCWPTCVYQPAGCTMCAGMTSSQAGQLACTC